MVSTAEHASAAGARPARRRRRRVIAAVAAAALVLAGTLTTLGVVRHLDHQYGPLQGGQFSGPYSDRGLVFSKHGDSYHLGEEPGATARLIASLDNRGAHSVQITSIETGDMVSDIRWSVYRVVNGGSVDGVATRWRRFPAIVRAHGTIRLLLTIHHPSNCSAYPSYHRVSDARYGGPHLVHWESLLHSHTTLVEVLLDPGDQGIRVC